jgi:DNA-directed RNA polymerase subunit RPC12/RpoP
MINEIAVESVQLRCPRCGQPLRQFRIKEEEGLYICSQCSRGNDVFVWRITGKLRHNAGRGPVEMTQVSIDISTPARFWNVVGCHCGVTVLMFLTHLPPRRYMINILLKPAGGKLLR